MTNLVSGQLVKPTPAPPKNRIKVKKAKFHESGSGQRGAPWSYGAIATSKKTMLPSYLWAAP